MIAAGYSWIPFWCDISYGFDGEFFYSWEDGCQQTYSQFQSCSWARARDNTSWSDD